MEILLKEGRKYTLFNNSHGLTFSDGKSPGHILAPDCTGIFDIAFRNRAFAAYVSDSGEIMLLENIGKGWKKSVLLKSRSGTMDIFGLRLIVSGENLNLIYGLKHNSENLIVHHTVPGGTPQVITSSLSETFFVRRDSSGCIYIINEAAEKVWHFCFMRNGVWSSPEELVSGCILEDVMTDGFKSFCTLYRNEEGYFAGYGDTLFEIKGKKPYLVKYNDIFRVISERDGRIYSTDTHSELPLITSDTVKDYILRMPDSGEYAVCEKCRGSFIHGTPRLFLIDRIKPPSSLPADSITTELTKRIIDLEAKVAQLEDKLRT